MGAAVGSDLVTDGVGLLLINERFAVEAKRSYIEWKS